jgi:hypothetical protein
MMDGNTTHTRRLLFYLTVGFVGRIVVAIIGAGWTLATAMTLPVLVEENVGPIEAGEHHFACHLHGGVVSVCDRQQGQCGDRRGLAGGRVLAEVIRFGDQASITEASVRCTTALRPQRGFTSLTAPEFRAYHLAEASGDRHDGNESHRLARYVGHCGSW